LRGEEERVGDELRELRGEVERVGRGELRRY